MPVSGNGHEVAAAAAVPDNTATHADWNTFLKKADLGGFIVDDDSGEQVKKTGKSKKRKAATVGKKPGPCVSMRTRGNHGPVTANGGTRRTSAHGNKRQKSISNSRVAQSCLWGLQLVGTKTVLLLGSSPVAPLCVIDNSADAFFNDTNDHVVVSHDMSTIYKSIFCLPAVLRGAKFVKNGDFDRQELAPRAVTAVWSAQRHESSVDFFKDFDVCFSSGQFNFHSQTDCTNSPGSGSHLQVSSSDVLAEFIHRQKVAAGVDGDLQQRDVRTLCIVGNACHSVVRRFQKKPDTVYVHFRIFFRILQYGYDPETVNTLLDGISAVGDFPSVCYTHCTCNLRPKGSDCPRNAPWFEELPSRSEVALFKDRLASSPAVPAPVAKISLAAAEDEMAEDRETQGLGHEQQEEQEQYVSDESEEIRIQVHPDRMEVDYDMAESGIEESEFGIRIEEPWGDSYSSSHNSNFNRTIPSYVRDWSDMESFAEPDILYGEYDLHPGDD